MGTVRDCTRQLHVNCQRLFCATKWELSETVRFTYMYNIRECVATTWVLSETVRCNYMGTVRDFVVKIHGY